MLKKKKTRSSAQIRHYIAQRAYTSASDAVQHPRNHLQARLAAGCWVDMENKLHINLDEFMAAFSISDTPTNRQTVKDHCWIIFKKKFPKAAHHRPILD